ncbi:HtaA domain-containing protein [Flaviflexus huanghaiensis]|uniref:HtaA domain-containing protein n=1 Tax=Flaviflexus huanghaiensis TaxID=1111473 RepID=UPI0015FB1B9D|nr:HtaA domain-containing protein [Flaviflexus huanghaiensis]
MNWGVKESFRRYLTSPFAGGDTELSGGVIASGDGFAWPVVAGGEIDSHGLTDLAFEGTVHFTAHEGILDVSLSNPTISFAGPTPVLTAEAASRAYNRGQTTPGELVTFGRVELATLPTATVTSGADVIDVSFGAGSLTEAGAKAFGGFYQPGDAIDPISISLATETVEIPAGPSCGPDAAPADLSALQGHMSWGLKSSFIGYLLGPAAGGTLNGCDGAWGTSSFNYRLADGTQFNPDAPDELRFVGTINLRAHSGVLDIDFTNPVLTFTDSTTAVLSLTSSGSHRGAAGGWSEEPIKVDDFARLSNVEIVTKSDGSISVTSESVTAGVGATFVLGAYQPGAPLDMFTTTVNPAAVVTTPEPVEPEPSEPAPTTPTTPEPVEPEPSEPAPTTPTAPVTPAKPPTPPAQPAPIGAGAMDWRVKDSFLRYVSGPMGGGGWTTSDGVTGTFRFPLAPGQNLNPQNLQTIKFGGTVDFTAHEGSLRIRLANPTVRKSGKTWQLTATVASRSMQSTEAPGVLPAAKSVVLADLSDPKVSTGAGGSTSLSFDEVKLTSEGAAAFAGFYPVETVLAPITMNLATAGSGLPPTPDRGSTDGTSNTPGVSSPKPVVQNPAPVIAEPQIVDRSGEIDPTKTRVTSGTLQWGVRQSFTTYIRSAIAGGGWTTSGGASWNGSTFVFPARGGLYNTAARSGEIHYGGTVSFSGHDDVLQLTMSNPSIVINGNTASLYLTVRSSSMDGVAKDHGRVHFANLTLSNVQSSNQALSFTTSSAVLTAAGAEAFAGFYEAGTDLAPLTVSVNLAPATVFDPQTGELKTYDAFGKLAYTGASSYGLALAGLVMLLAGAAALRFRKITA